ncbi:MAG: uridine kinase [Rhodothermales bacterium]|nr:uridine kinase [Rhodothermales bacterium]
MTAHPPSGRPVFVGLAGGSGSGKSTVMDRVLEAVGRDNVAVLDHDAYYRDLAHLTLVERAAQNFDHPESLETELLCEHLDSLRAGRTIQKPVYNFTTHSRADESVTVEPRPVVMVEGILVLADPDLVERLDLRVFVRADDDIRLVRRIRRDISERGRSIESVLTQYESTVRPMYMRFVQPSMRQADLIVPRGGHNHAAIDVLIGYLKSLLAEH